MGMLYTVLVDSVVALVEDFVDDFGKHLCGGQRAV